MGKSIGERSNEKILDYKHMFDRNGFKLVSQRIGDMDDGHSVLESNKLGLYISVWPARLEMSTRFKEKKGKKRELDIETVMEYYGDDKELPENLNGREAMMMALEIYLKQLDIYLKRLSKKAEFDLLCSYKDEQYLKWKDKEKAETTRMQSAEAWKDKNYFMYYMKMSEIKGLLSKLDKKRMAYAQKMIKAKGRNA